MDSGFDANASPRNDSSSSWPGFVPAIHVFISKLRKQDVDAREAVRRMGRAAAIPIASLSAALMGFATASTHPTGCIASGTRQLRTRHSGARRRREPGIHRAAGASGEMDSGFDADASPRNDSSSSWPGFVPAIHVFISKLRKQDVDAREAVRRMGRASTIPIASLPAAVMSFATASTHPAARCERPRLVHFGHNTTQIGWGNRAARRCMPSRNNVSQPGVVFASRAGRACGASGAT